MKRRQNKSSGVALIIVLAFVVLMLTLTLAYFTRTVTDRRVAHSSFNQTKADELAASATDVIIADLKQEITSPTASTSATPGNYTIYTPTSNAYMVPLRSGTPAAGQTPIPNLVRRSVASDPMPSPGVKSRASAVNSTTASLNGRSVTTARWNEHYIIPRVDQSSTATDSTPVTSFTAPDWVFVTNSGPVVIAAPTPSVVGRYAYAIYDGGGLLDTNAAGYPTTSTIAQSAPKGSIAYADLTTLPMTTASPAPTFPPFRVDDLVGWRNYVSAKPSAGDFASDFSFNANSASSYFNFIIANNTGFMKPASGVSTDGHTDQALLTRQELLGLRSSLGQGPGFSQNALQYFGTFSREISTPQWSPASPSGPNANFQTLTVTGSSFTRNDGTTANVGDYVVNKRFNLQRLNWLTYKGPSATAPGGTRNAVPTTVPSTPSNPDWDLWLLKSQFGLTASFLQDQSVGGTAANILKYFGLAWDSTNERWNYAGHSGGSTPLSSIAALTSSLGRDPDFFELLQAGILSGSIGDSYSPYPTLLPVNHQQSAMLHILTIGANLIAQSRADSYPVRIACSVGGTIMEAVGAPRLPYLNSLAACPVAGIGWYGGVNWFLVPNLWDPFRNNWDLTEANTALTPNYPRPTVRISVSGSVGIGTVASYPRSGSVPSASVTPSPSPSAILAISPPQSLTLTTGSARGRDGFLEAASMGTPDCTPAPAAFVTTTSASPTPSAQWNSIPYPSPTPNPTPIGSNVAFRISYPGSSIPNSWTTGTQNPVLGLLPGFQMTLDYQSPNGQWYSYSFLQGNSASPNASPSATPHNTWISAGNVSSPSLNVTTTLSRYAYASPTPTPPSPPPGGTPYPTIISGSPTAATLWNVPALAQAPMFAKADPRSIRYNSQIGVVGVTAPPTVASSAAGVIGSIWPNGYATPPPMTTGSTPSPTPTPPATPTPTPSTTPSATPSATVNPPNPATLGDNAPASTPGNPYNEVNGSTWRPMMMNRPFRSVGEMGYAFRDQPFRTLNFASGNSPDAGLLDLFCVNDYTDSSSRRAGVININSRQVPVIATMLANIFTQESTPGSTPSPTPSPAPFFLSSANATSIATSLTSQTSITPIKNKADLPGLIANQATLGWGLPKTQRESIARALGEADQTRTWNLLIDVIAQAGHYKPNPTNLASDFVVEGEQRYWVHVAIDRFTGQVIDKQVEVVNE